MSKDERHASASFVEWLEESFVDLAGWKKPPMLVGIVPFLLAFGGPNVGKRPLLRQAGHASHAPSRRVNQTWQACPSLYGMDECASKRE